MRINNAQEIKSSVIKISDIEDLADKISQLFEKDNKRNKYQRGPEFEINQKNNFNFKFDNKEEFFKHIKSNIDEIKSFKISYWGDEDRISIACGDYRSSFNVDTQSKGKSLEYIEYINRIFKEKSWNDVANQGWVQLPVTLIVFFILILFLSILDKPFLIREFYSIVFILYVFASIMGIISGKYISRIYLNLVLKNDNEIHGRIFKGDLWKIIGSLAFIIFSAWVGKILFR